LGHEQAFDKAVEMLRRFDGFLGGLLEACDPEETLVVVTSDHGNVEDCSHGKHTTNPALTLLLGAPRLRYAARIRALTDFVPAIVDFLAGDAG
jgi:bisphosphoglycerate-independent phosphoglycerate mutase (AlkP superfamily)